MDYVMHISPDNFVVLHDDSEPITSRQFNSELSPRQIVDEFLKYMGSTTPQIQFKELDNGYVEYTITL